MLTYLIDGFNLFHKIRSIEDSVTPRRDLVNYLKVSNLTGSRANRVVIVFDGYETGELHSDPEYHIVFSNARTADDLIKERCRAVKHKRSLIVVSDDIEIRNSIKSEGAVAMSTQEFLSKPGGARKRSSRRSSDADRGLPPSKMMDITEEMKKIWVK